MATVSVPERIILRGGTNISLSDRFGHLAQSSVEQIRVRMVNQQQVAASNQRFAQQMLSRSLSGTLYADGRDEALASDNRPSALLRLGDRGGRGGRGRGQFRGRRLWSGRGGRGKVNQLSSAGRGGSSVGRRFRGRPFIRQVRGFQSQREESNRMDISVNSQPDEVEASDDFFTRSFRGRGRGRFGGRSRGFRGGSGGRGFALGGRWQRGSGRGRGRGGRGRSSWRRGGPAQQGVSRAQLDEQLDAYMNGS